MKKATFAIILAGMIALTGCTGGNSGSEESASSSTESATNSAPEETSAPGETSAPETAAPTAESAVPTVESAEPTSEPEQSAQPQIAELIGMTIGDIESIYSTELAPSDVGYLGSPTFDVIGAELAFKPLAEVIAADYKVTIVTGIFVNTPCPILDGITGEMTYNQLSEFIDDPAAYAPEPNAIDGSTSTMFFYKGYKFMVMWADYTDFDSPCYSITVTADAQ